MGDDIRHAHLLEFLRRDLPRGHRVIDDLIGAPVHSRLLHLEKRHARPKADERPGNLVGVRHDPTHVEFAEHDKDQKIQDDRRSGQAPQAGRSKYGREVLQSVRSLARFCAPDNAALHPGLFAALHQQRIQPKLPWRLSRAHLEAA